MERLIRAPRLSSNGLRLHAAHAVEPKPVATPMVAVAAPAPPMISEAEHERRLAAAIERMRARAEERGYQDGRARAAAEIAQRIDREVAHLRTAIEAARSAMDARMDGLLDIGAEIVFEAVCKIVGTAALDHAGAIAIVRETIARARDEHALVVRVHPNDRALFERAADRLAASGRVSVVADERVRWGGCLLDTSAGTLDGRLETQLARLRDVLSSARQSQQATAAASPDEAAR